LAAKRGCRARRTGILRVNRHSTGVPPVKVTAKMAVLQ